MENDFGTDHNEDIENDEDFGTDIESDELSDLDDVENEDDIMDDFEDADDMDEADMVEDEAIDLESGSVSVKVGDSVVNISMDAFSEEDEDNGDYDDGDADELDDAFDDAELDEDFEVDDNMEFDSEEEEKLEESAQASVGTDSSKTNHAETMDQSQKNAKGGALNSTPSSEKSESKPAEDIATALKNVSADLDDISSRDIDNKGKHMTDSQPAESQDASLKNVKGDLDGEEEDDSVNSTKNDGKQTSDVLKGITYEGFAKKADDLFNESFDSQFRNSGKAKK